MVEWCLSDICCQMISSQSYIKQGRGSSTVSQSYHSKTSYFMLQLFTYCFSKPLTQNYFYRPNIGHTMSILHSDTSPLWGPQNNQHTISSLLRQHVLLVTIGFLQPSDFEQVALNQCEVFTINVLHWLSSLQGNLGRTVHHKDHHNSCPVLCFSSMVTIPLLFIHPVLPGMATNPLFHTLPDFIA